MRIPGKIVLMAEIAAAPPSSFATGREIVEHYLASGEENIGIPNTVSCLEVAGWDKS
jgi:hypothetical protein